MPSPKAALDTLRDRRPALDHLIRAYQRYSADTGDRLAAAVTFFGFLSFFPLLALAVSLLALVLRDDAVSTVVRTVNDYSPGLADQLGLRELLRNNTKAGLTGLIGLAGLLLSGLGWVDALREALRTIWHQNVQAGNVVTKKLADVLILAGLGIALVVSVLVSAATGSFTGLALRLVGLDDSVVAAVLVKVIGIVASLLTSTVIFLYLFIRLPKVQTPWRRVVKGAVLAAVLFEVLKQFGAFYIARTTQNPLYGTFAVVVGLLVWINVVVRMLLLAAAWTVTAPYDSDVAPSGTADPEQARKAGIPLSFADDDPDHPPAIQSDGAPSPLLAAVQGRRPPQDEPAGPPGQQELGPAAARRARVPRDPSAQADAGLRRSPAERHEQPADDGPPAPRAGAGLPGEVATRRVAQAGAALLSAGLVAVAVYAVRTAAGLRRR